eukprot:EG_transcript_7451
MTQYPCVLLLLVLLCTAKPYLPLHRDPLPVSDIDRLIGGIKIYVYATPPAVLAKQKTSLGLHNRLEWSLLEALTNLSGQPGSALLTTEGDEADFFWVPHALFDNFPNDEYVENTLLPYLSHIQQDFPFYNRSGGRDHVFVYIWDNGPLCDLGFFGTLWQKNPMFKRLIHPMIIVGYHGSQGLAAPPETHSALRRHCFQPGHDISVPQWNTFHLRQRRGAFTADWLRGLATGPARNIRYFGTFASGRCSPRVRFHAHEFMRQCYSPHLLDPCRPQRSCWPETGIFGLAPAGFGCWSARFFDFVSQLVVPVIMADHIEEPFERFLDYRRFTVKVMTGTELLRIKELEGVEEVVKVPDDVLPKIYAVKFPTLEALHPAASAFRLACGPCGTPGNGSAATAAAACLANPVARKLRALLQHRPWLSWNLRSPRNALKLFLLELHCRTARGRRHAVCRHDVAAPGGSIAMMDYGV